MTIRVSYEARQTSTTDASFDLEPEEEAKHNALPVAERTAYLAACAKEHAQWADDWAEISTDCDIYRVDIDGEEVDG